MYHKNFFNMNHQMSSTKVQDEKKSPTFILEKMTLEDIDSSLTKMKILERKIRASLKVIVERYVGEYADEDISRNAKLGWNLYRL